MRVLKVHNFYQQPGGEDTVFTAETAALRGHGHEVVEFTDDNRRIDGLRRARLALDTIWSGDAHRKTSSLIASVRPDVVHFHNTFPLISPSAYYACRDAGVPVAQSLHNPRLVCPAATFYRDGQACDDCLGKTFPWPGVLHACYRGSRTQTAVVAAMVSVHRLAGTWTDVVGVYFVSAEFYHEVFLRGGLPPEKLVVMPHFVDPDPGVRSGPGDYALFVGRLKPEKGIATLLRAWEGLEGIPLKIRGDGELDDVVRRFAADRRRGDVEVVGRLSRDQLQELMKGAKALVWPSEGFYETFGFVAVEAFACGVPVIASRIGVMKDIVDHGRTGLLFNPGDPDDLRAAVKWVFARPAEGTEMGRRARLEYEAKYTAERGYKTLVDTYTALLARRRAL